MTDPGGPLLYCPWGAPPQPVLEEEPKRGSWFGSSLVVLVMFGWMVLVFGLGALVARNDPNVEVPMPVARGVVVNPADGWYSASDRWDVGEDAITLQRAGVLAGFWVEPYQGTNDEYLATWLSGLGQGLDQLRALPAASVVVAGDLPGLMVRFTGVSSDLGREEDELIVVTHKGIAVAMWVRADPGQLGWVQGDIDRMLYQLVIPR